MNQKSINVMSIKELVVCKFKDCKQVYNDVRTLPCGNRTCATHIKEMIQTTAKTDADRKMLKCYFCQTIHNIPDDGKGFPVDNYIPHLLNMSYSCEHDAAKKSFNEMTHLLDKLSKLNKEECAIGYFERVGDSLHKLIDFYEALVDDVHKRQFKWQAHQWQDQVEEKQPGLRSQDARRWRNEVERHTSRVQHLLQDDAVTRRRTQRENCRRVLLWLEKKCNCHAQCQKVCSTFSFLAIESAIISNEKMKSELFNVCKLRGKQFKLIYRASRDGFEQLAFTASATTSRRQSSRQQMDAFLAVRLLSFGATMTTLIYFRLFSVSLIDYPSLCWFRLK